MPFRVPKSYSNFEIMAYDPDHEDLAKYVRWLKAELQLAEIALQQRTPTKPETPKET